MNRNSTNTIKADVFQRWIAGASAQRLLVLEAGWLGDAVSRFHGLHAAYAGIDPTPRFLDRSRCAHRFRLDLPWQQQANFAPGAARIDDAAWPLADESLDLVVLQHALDMSRRPHQLIREACRTLIADGYLVVAGFNPYSWWGGVRWVNTFSSNLPWVSNPVSPLRLRDWLLLLDMHLESVAPIAHCWPLYCGSEGLSRRIDRVAANASWLPGNGYLLVARKTVAGLTPIRRQKRFALRSGFAMPVPVGYRDAPTLPSRFDGVIKD